jgi:hypothetical protein
MEILKEAQKLSSEQVLIDRYTLAEWIFDPRFVTPASDSQRVCIDGHVSGTSELSFKEQEAFLASRGLSKASLEDVAVALVVNLVATGNSLIGWCMQELRWRYAIRVGGGLLTFSHEGSLKLYEDMLEARADVIVAVRLP